MPIDIDGPSGVIWAAITFPFGWRALVAAMIWARVRGFLFLPANVAPRVELSDFPPPNGLLREFATLVAANAIGIPVAVLLEPTLRSAAPSAIWSPLFVILTTALIVALYWRLRRDDRRWLTLKLDRIAQASPATASDARR